MYELGLSITGGKLHIDNDYKHFDEEFFKNCAKTNIKHIEISYGIVKPYYELDHKALKKMADSYGINLWTYHLPFKPSDEVDISLSDKAIKERSRKTISELVKMAGDIGIDKYVIHPSFVFDRDEIGESGLYERMQMKFLQNNP